MIISLWNISKYTTHLNELSSTLQVKKYILISIAVHFLPPLHTYEHQTKLIIEKTIRLYMHIKNIIHPMPFIPINTKYLQSNIRGLKWPKIKSCTFSSCLKSLHRNFHHDYSRSSPNIPKWWSSYDHDYDDDHHLRWSLNIRIYPQPAPLYQWAY